VTSARGRRELVGTALATAIGAQIACASRLHAAQPNEGNQGIMAAPSFASRYATSLSATAMTGEAADRLAVRNPIDAWAHCADRRLAEQQPALFTTDSGYALYDGDPETRRPVGVRRGRSEIVKALAALNKFVATKHFNRQSVIAIQGDHAVDESYCLAHQLLEVDGKRTLQLPSIRYLDTFIREGDRWLFTVAS
jgi:hypothetical protein